ncbi:phage portal protein [Mycobacterium kubicae]|uniref:phage portal protein n=1 Tax=Mycobacterium kubicae TaxID=120959 RepID=UPI0008024803|nr:phage portal protein [Mycobacterium kubicae]OBK42076.1 phage portal protein [Mycobacterium kubicae]
MAWWKRNRTAAETRASWSVGDPAVAELFGLGTPNLAGMSVGETSVLGLASVYRAVSLISGSIASLPMRTITTNADGHTERAKSFLDTPAGPGKDVMTAFELKETVLLHLLLHGNCYLGHVFGGAGQIVGLVPIHPLAVTPEIHRETGLKFFTVSLADGTQRVLFSDQLTHVPALSLDGIKGLSPIALARNIFATSMAGDAAAARMFGNGMMISGLVSADDDLSADEALTIKNDLRQRIQGTNNAGDVVLINRKLKFDKWSMSAEDAQFLQSRAFQVEEVARWFGLQPMHLGQTDKQTSWGTGVQEQNRGLARYVLEPWTTRIQERLSRLLTGNKKVEFDYSAFLNPDPETEINLLIAQIDAGLLTVNEARKIRNMPPLPEDDEPATDDEITDSADVPESQSPELRIASETPAILAPTALVLPESLQHNGKAVVGHG